MKSKKIDFALKELNLFERKDFIRSILETLINKFIDATSL